MRYSGTIWPTFGIAVTLLFAAGSAEALRCSSNVVSEGDNTAALEKKCGQPTRVEQFDRRVSQRVYGMSQGDYYTEEVAFPYEVWTYNFGPRRLLTLITVENGKILRIETNNGYGY